jgi:hypothetical protein
MKKRVGVLAMMLAGAFALLQPAAAQAQEREGYRYYERHDDQRFREWHQRDRERAWREAHERAEWREHVRWENHYGRGAAFYHNSPEYPYVARPYCQR